MCCIGRLITQLDSDSAFIVAVSVSDLWVLSPFPSPTGGYWGFRIRPVRGISGGLVGVTPDHVGLRFWQQVPAAMGVPSPPVVHPLPSPHPWDCGRITSPIGRMPHQQPGRLYALSMASPSENDVKAGAGIKIVIHNAFCLFDILSSWMVGTYSFLNIIHISPHLSPIPGRWQPMVSFPVYAIRLSLSATRRAPWWASISLSLQRNFPDRPPSWAEDCNGT